MIKAFAPRSPRGYSWVLLSIAVILGWASPTEAQQGKSAPSKPASEATPSKNDEKAKNKEDSKKDGAKKDEDAPEEKAEKKEAEAEEPEAPKKEPSVEVFTDPRAEAILQKKFSAVGRLGNPNDKKTVLNMAGGTESFNRPIVERFVDGATQQITNPANLAAMVEADKPARNALEIKKGTDDLIEVLRRARENKNAEFLTQYNRILLEKLPRLLENNLFARIEAMIVLGQTGNPDAIPIFVKQLEDANQTVWVKVWAARGITSAAGGGTRDLPPAQSTPAAKALAAWLEKETDLPWFAQLRGLEGLGALRQAKTPQNPGRPDFANVAMKFLADSDARPEVRAMAAWALGMMRVDNALGKFNFPLVAYNIAEVAADLGDKVNEVFDANQNQSRYYTSFLLYQIHPALEGPKGVREAGLLNVPGGHPAMTQAQPFLKQVDALVTPVAKASVELLNAPRGKYKDLQKELGKRVAALRAFLKKNPPADVRLVPGGQEFPFAKKEKKEKVAEAPVAK